MGSITDRMKGAALLDNATYEEVEADTTATGQAAIVVVLGAIASGIGMARAGSGGIVMAVVGSLIGWALWAGITYLIGDKVLGGTATWGELLRTLGFAQAPRVLMVLGHHPRHAVARRVSGRNLGPGHRHRRDSAGAGLFHGQGNRDRASWLARDDDSSGSARARAALVDLRPSSSRPLGRRRRVLSCGRDCVQPRGR
jgi:hypothetical protein